MCGHPQFFANTHARMRPCSILRKYASTAIRIIRDRHEEEQRTLVEDEQNDQFFVNE
jgi:hypothetical protein